MDKSPDYCNDLVEKSVCNPVKNECFCRSGYVAIREDEKITCKTLLTNLKCRIDSDCIDVQNSSCHPGAGKCACPYNTVYVPDLHACRQRIKRNLSQFCKICLEKKGDCFLYDLTDKMTLFYNQSNSLIGCACLNGRQSIADVDMNHMCSSYMVDIGEYCDEENYFCHSKFAVCSKRNSFSLQNRFCSCNFNQIAIYQNVLDYHECFDVIRNSDICINCEKNGGSCYDENKNGVPDGCKCPQHLSHTVDDYSLKYDHLMCSINHVIVDCSNNYLSVCYIPHHHSPYHNLMQKLKQNHSIAGINIRQIHTRYRERCKLVYQRNREFCIQIFESELFSECSIYKTHFQNKKIMYKANLQIIYDASSTSSRDMQFPIKCITDDVSLFNSQRFTTPGKPTLSFVKINLDFINDNEEVIQSVAQNEPIKLQIQLISNHQYFSRTEACYLSNNSASGVGKQSFESVKIITNGCPESLHGFYARFQNVILSKNKVISEGFFAFSRYQVDSIMIKCTIKVCLEQIDCQPVICYDNSNQINDKSHLISTNQWIYVERWAKLFLHKNNSNKNNNQIQVLTCNHLICLSMNQTMLLALLLSGLVIALISLLIIYGSSKTQNIKVKKKDLFNIQNQTLSFPTSQSGCTSCSGSSQIRSYVTFKTMDMKSCTPIKCYPLVDFSRQNVPQNIPSEFDRLSNNINIESINEIYEC